MLAWRRCSIAGNDGGASQLSTPMYSRASGLVTMVSWVPTATPPCPAPALAPPERTILSRAAAKRFKKVENATAVIWKILLIAEQRLTRPSCYGKSPRASRTSTGHGRSRATRRPPPDLVYTLLDETSSANGRSQ